MCLVPSASKSHTFTLLCILKLLTIKCLFNFSLVCTNKETILTRFVSSHCSISGKELSLSHSSVTLNTILSLLYLTLIAFAPFHISVDCLHLCAKFTIHFNTLHNVYRIKITNCHLHLNLIVVLCKVTKLSWCFKLNTFTHRLAILCNKSIKRSTTGETFVLKQTQFKNFCVRLAFILSSNRTFHTFATFNIFTGIWLSCS